MLGLKPLLLDANYYKLPGSCQTRIGPFQPMCAEFLKLFQLSKCRRHQAEPFDHDLPFCRNDLKPGLLQTQDVLISYSKSKKLPDFF